MARWQYREQGAFHDIASEASTLIEREYAFLKGAGKFDYDVEGRPYTVCFNRFTQMNVETGSERDVRRAYNAPGWAWKADGQWEPYEATVGKKIENAFIKKTSKPFAVRINPEKTVLVDLLAMTQTNEDTGKERNIKRITAEQPLPKDRLVTEDGQLVFLKRTIENITNEAEDSDDDDDHNNAKKHQKTSKTVWEWRTDSKTNPWVPYSEAVSLQIEAAHSKGVKKIQVSPSEGVDLTIDLGKMTQFREETNGCRKIRRSEDLEKKPRESSASPSEEEESEDDTAAKKIPPGTSWVTHDTVIALPSMAKPSSVVIAFDMDDTLITTKSGKVHPATATDWKWLDPSVKPTLLKHYKDGAKIVIFSNQAGIGKKGHNGPKAKQIKQKIEAMTKDLGIPIQAFASICSGMFRKPNPGMWELMAAQYNNGVKLNMSKCCYVGDAAGRMIQTLGGKAKDFSCGDRKFAHNVGVQFHTPEAFFLGAKEAKFHWGGGFSPIETKFPTTPTPDGSTTFHKPKQEVVVMVGYPGSGKSTFAKKYFVSHGYVHVNRDTLKTAAKCIKLLKESLAAGSSVVIDNTNPKPETRKEITAIAKSFKVPARCFFLSTSYELSRHLNSYREVITKGAHAHVPGIAYNMYRSGFKKPEVKEGFESVDEVSFVPDFKSPKEKAAFNMFLSE